MKSVKPLRLTLSDLMEYRVNAVVDRVEVPCLVPGAGPVPRAMSLLGAKAPAKIQEVTLMRPIHGNL